MHPILPIAVYCVGKKLVKTEKGQHIVQVTQQKLEQFTSNIRQRIASQPYVNTDKIPSWVKPQPTQTAPKKARKARSPRQKQDGGHTKSNMEIVADMYNAGDIPEHVINAAKKVVAKHTAK